MGIETRDGKDAELEPVDVEDEAGEATLRRKRRAMRVPSDEVPRPTAQVVNQPVHVESEIEFDVDVDAPDEPAGGNGRAEAAQAAGSAELVPPGGTAEPAAASEAPSAVPGGSGLADAAAEERAAPVLVADAVTIRLVTAPVAEVASDAEPALAELAATPVAAEPAPAAPEPAAGDTEPAIAAIGETSGSGGEHVAAEEVELSPLELEEEQSDEEHRAPARASRPGPPNPPPAASAARAPAAPPKPPPPRQVEAVAAALEPRPKKRRLRAWFEEIFDEDYLRTLPFLTAHTTQREAAYLIEALGLRPGQQVLDLGCGYGRHAMELAARGINVLALDLSLALLVRGMDEAGRRGLNINFVHGDMRELAYDAQFDGAYCIFSTFGFFDDDTNKRVAQGLARSLKPGGRLVLEILNRDYIIADLPTRVWWEGDSCVVLEEVDFNYFNSRILSQRQIVFEDGRQVEQEISIRAYSLHEVGKLLHGAGFRVLQVSGGMSARGRFFGKDSRQIIVVAEKRADLRDATPPPDHLTGSLR
jgi:ubiquinone/menaquinone biosynthesis C-methylase UbiE